MTVQDYNALHEVTNMLHGSLNISGGYKLEKKIYEVIKNSKRHDAVYSKYPIQLLKETGEEDRENHEVDILAVDAKMITAYNSKSWSFNNTLMGLAPLQEYRRYKKGMEKKFPDKEVEYIILKPGYKYGKKDKVNTQMDYLVDHGVPVYNTEQYLRDNYNSDFEKIVNNPRKLQALEHFKAKCDRMGFDYNILLKGVKASKI